MVEKSKVIGIMLQHLELLKEDIEAIFKILEKYGDDNDSVRGDLKVINQEKTQKTLTVILSIHQKKWQIS